MRQHANDSFAQKPPRPKTGYGVGGLRKNDVATACAEVLEACDAGDAEALRRTLESHTEVLPDIVNARDGNGWTALHVAVGWCAEECIALLLKTGADPAICNDQGQNPRDLAFQLGYESLAVHIAPVEGAREAAARKAHQAQLSREISIITQGLPEAVTITCCKIRADLRRPNL